MGILLTIYRKGVCFGRLYNGDWILIETVGCLGRNDGESADAYVFAFAGSGNLIGKVISTLAPSFGACQQGHDDS